MSDRLLTVVAVLFLLFGSPFLFAWDVWTTLRCR